MINSFDDFEETLGNYYKNQREYINNYDNDFFRLLEKARSDSRRDDYVCLEHQ